MGKRVVYKQKLMLNKDAQSVTVRNGAKLLTVALQHYRPCLWFETDTDSPACKITIQAFGTGSAEIPENAVYIATTSHYNDHFILHWYEIEEG